MLRRHSQALMSKTHAWASILSLNVKNSCLGAIPHALMSLRPIHVAHHTFNKRESLACDKDDEEEVVGGTL